MADVRLSVQPIVQAGLTPVYTGSLTATTVDYVFKNDGKTFLHVKKAGAGDCVATITTPVTVDGKAVADLAVTVVATTGDKMIGPFPPAVFNDGNGDARVMFSEITGLTAGVFRL
jgi:hypothetical protein